MFRLIFESMQPFSGQTTTANVGPYDKPVGGVLPRLDGRGMAKIRKQPRKRRKWSVLDD